jgi:hypothetical protein
MTGNYLFKLRVSGKTDEEIVQDAYEQLDAWADDFCTENNWYKTLLLVLKDGRMLSLLRASDGDEEGPEYMKEMVETWPDPEKRYKEFERHALECMVYELRVLNLPYLNMGTLSPEEEAAEEELERYSFEELVAKIHEVVPAQLAKLYADLVGKPVEHIQFGGLTMPDWKRARLVESYEIFRESFDVPFDASGRGNPSNYRAFDLRVTPLDDEEEIEAIAIVEIHT